MKNWSLKTKIVALFFAVFVVSGLAFSDIAFRQTSGLVVKDVGREAQRHINRTMDMFMVPTRKFDDEFSKAKLQGKADGTLPTLVLEDARHTKSALADAVTYDSGDEAVRVRLIGDAEIFGIEPLGDKEKIGIQIPFERDAALAIKQGKDRFEAQQGGFLRIAVPLTSQAHPGCAACHLSLRKGFDSDLKQNIILGTLNVYMPLRAAIAKERGKTLQFIYMTMIMLALIACALYYFMRRLVTSPIGQAVALIKRIAQGDLSVDFTVQQNDEIGMLAGSMNKMVGNLRELAGAAEKIAEGDLMVQVAALSDKDTLGNALKKMVEKLSTIIAEINHSAQTVLSGAEQLSDSSQAMSQGATEQASSLEEISSSMNQIASQTRQNSENAMLASKIAGESRAFAEKGDQQMQDMVAAMHEISDSSKSISKIIKIIDEIAFQINLLALNAAVEAARAGKHGKGFAVVAEEVRNLAARSAKAAKETEAMIEAAVKRIDEGTSMAGRTAGALQEVVAAAGKVTDLVAEISAASNEQAQGVAQINQGLGHVDQITQQNTAHAEESASAAEELTGQARVLQELVTAFKIEEGRLLSGAQAHGLPAGRQKMLDRPGKGNGKKYTAGKGKSHAQWGGVTVGNISPAPVIDLDSPEFGKY